LAAAAPVSKSYIVVLNDGVAHPRNVAQRHEENRGAEVDHVYATAIKGYSAELTAEGLQAIKQDPTVDYVVRDGVAHAAAQVPSTGFKRVFAPSNPNLAINEVDDVRTNADIAIIDTGVYLHPDLNVVARTNCMVSSACAEQELEDGYGHGTHVAGIAGAIDNNFGVVGTAPGARIWGVKAGNQKGVFPMSAVIAAVNWVTARSSQIEVVNMSLGCEAWECDGAQMPLKEAIATSVDKGVVYVVAAGNSKVNVSGSTEAGYGSSDPYYPADFPDVITVSALSDFDGAPGGLGSTPSCFYEDYETKAERKGQMVVLGKDQDDTLADYSNWGPAVDIAAPGTCLNSTWPGGGYKEWSGTSMAAPMVAGAVAGLAEAKNPNNRQEVEAIRTFIRGLGNYNWTDTHLVIDATSAFYTGDGVKEPLLNMSDLTAPPKAPDVSTTANPPVGSTTATLDGWLNPNGAETRFYFQYGTTSAYGTNIPAPPGSSIGSGTSPQHVVQGISGLEPETTYHYRLLASNSQGTSYGADQAFRTTPATLGSPSVLLDQADDQTWVHSRNASSGTLQYANWKGSTGWSTVNLGTSMRAGSKQAPLLDKTTKQQWVYYADDNGQLNYWNWKTENGWNHYTLGTTVRQGTSPVAVLDQATKQQWVYYVGTDGQLKLWNWTLANGWIHYSLGSAVAPGTSPTVSFDEATKETSVYFVRPDTTIGQMRWTVSLGWQQATLGASARAGTSPTVVLHQGSKQQWVYFVAADGALKYFNYNPASGWSLFALSASVAPNTSPTAIIDPATYQQWVYYPDPSGNIDYWNWNSGSGWLPYSLTGPVAPGTSVAVALDLASKQQWVYYRRSDGVIHYWNWNSVGGWKHY
jgi:hypothetical protein